MKRIFISILILAPLLAFAQFSDAGAGATIRISPSLPNPLSQTKASLIYDGFDLTKASIRWTLNNKTIKSGTGAKDVTFQVGPAGSDNRLSVFGRNQSFYSWTYYWIIVSCKGIFNNCRDIPFRDMGSNIHSLSFLFQ